MRLRTSRTLRVWRAGWSGRQTASGFTLPELLVCVGIVVVLIALAIPAVGRVRESARRTSDISHLRQLTAACVCYAQQNDGAFPPGRMDDAAPGADDYTWTNYATCWKPLLSLEPGLSTINSCASVREGYAQASGFGQPQGYYGYGGDVQLGWIYWAGRDDLWAEGALKYRSLRHLGDRLTPGSQTLWTCWCWDSAGHNAPSVCPHVGTRYVQYQPGVTLKPPPDGLAVALTDGSASFVAWNDMIIIPQANGYKLYYQP